jgi:hypothetical protein
MKGPFLSEQRWEVPAGSLRYSVSLYKRSPDEDFGTLKDIPLKDLRDDPEASGVITIANDGSCAYIRSPQGEDIRGD